MKKILLTVLAILMIASMAEAGIFDDAVNYIKERPMKAGISYDIDGKDALSTLGTKLSGIGKFDIDLLLSGAGLDLFNDNDVIVSAGASYNLPVTTNTKLSIGGSLGVKRFESFNNGETGELKPIVSILLNHKF